MTVTKKQTSIAIFAVVFATAMIVGTLASATSDNMAFAGGNNRHSNNNHGNNNHGNNNHKNNSHGQSTAQTNNNDQRSLCIASGGISVANGLLAGISLGGNGGTITGSCNNLNSNTNANAGNNVQ
jgi:hypothetical protein